MSRKHVVILGGGFAGLACARALSNSDVQITIIDKQTQHTFAPLLYQVATAGLTAADVSAPLRHILRKQNNVRVLLDEALSVSAGIKSITLRNYGDLQYDYLVVCTGLQQTYFGNDHWAKHAPGLKSIDDALEMRKRMLLAFERAEASSSVSEQQELLTFVVVGGGPTGVELAGAIREIALHTLARDFSNINPAKARVLLIEGSSNILSSYSKDLSYSAEDQLEELGVEVLTDSFVSDVNSDGILLSGGRFIPAGCVFWGAGVAGTPISKTLDTPLTRDGRLFVEKDLSLPDHKNTFVAGDLAYWKFDDMQVPAVAPAAIQMGRAVAKNIKNDLSKKERKDFKYIDKGSLATIGRHRAVGQIMGLNLKGFVAWVAWLLVHLMTLVDFKNRVFVFFKWSWHYLTWKSSARVLIGIKAEDIKSKNNTLSGNNSNDDQIKH